MIKKYLIGLIVSTVFVSAVYVAWAQVSEVTSLPSASTPLGGAELLGIVQNGQARKVTASALTGAGGSSTGASGAVQVSNGAGAFLDGGLFAVTGAFSHAPSSVTLTSTGQKFMSYDVSAAESSGLGTPTKFNFGVASFQNVNDACMGGNGRDNHVFVMGWNPLATSAREDVTQSKITNQWEQGFCIGGVMGHEWHLEQIDSAGVSHRPISTWMPWNGVNGSGVQGLTFASNVTNTLRYNTTANGTIGQQIWKMDAEQTPWTTGWYGRTTTEPHRIQSTANGCPWLQQRNAADSAYLDYPCYRSVAGVNEFFHGNGNPVVVQANQAAGTYASTAFTLSRFGTPINGGRTMYLTGSPVTTGAEYAFQADASATGNYLVSLFNNNNAAASNAVFEARTIGDAAGDPVFWWNINGIQSVTAGLDNSVVSNPFTISASSTLGTSNMLSLDPTASRLGAITLGSNCSSAAGTCGAAIAGSVSIAAAATTVTVASTSVTANSQILVMEDSSLGTKLGVTCNTTIARTYAVTARTAATSFVLTTSAAPVTNPACLSYLILN